MKLWIAIALVLGLAACGNHNITGDGQSIKQYDHDGYLGLTNTNPNLPGQYSYHTYQQDVKLIHQAAISVSGVKDTTVTIGNATANVGLILDHTVSSDEANRIREEALRAISYNLPRYKVNVSIK
jgi:hypothetical protein